MADSSNAPSTAVYRFRVRAPDGQEIVSDQVSVVTPALVSVVPPPPPAAAVSAGSAQAPVERPPLAAHHLQEAAVIKALVEGGHEEILKTHFGEAYEDLRDAAKAVAARAGGKKRRRVLMLPGVMASLIGEPQGSSNHVKWLDPTEIVRGNLFKLTFDASPIEGTSVAPLLPCYLPLKLRLQLADHDVDIMHYDWRHKLEDLGALLAKRIVGDKSDKITLVVHSMGGLVTRSALKQSAAANAKVEMVVQLGTPNLGAPTMAMAVRGTYPTLQTIAGMDLRHTADDYGRLVATFPGVYALMPPTGAPFGLALRDLSVWPKDGVQPRADLLASCGKSQDDLLVPDARFFLVAGANLDTVTNVRKQGDAFVYEYTLGGDGTVPVTSAKMKGITQAWFADGVEHDKLCMSVTTCDAAASILDGNSPKLPTAFKAKKDGITKTETDASLSKQTGAIAKIEGDARHVYQAVQTVAAKIHGADESLHTTMKKSGSWLRKHF
jgi:Lecithin:cholesterol acyltransferase